MQDHGGAQRVRSHFSRMVAAKDIELHREAYSLSLQAEAERIVREHERELWENARMAAEDLDQGHEDASSVVEDEEADEVDSQYATPVASPPMFKKMCFKGRVSPSVLTIVCFSVFVLCSNRR